MRLFTDILFYGYLIVLFLFFSGLAAGVYTTNSAEAVFHVLESSNANIVVVDDTKQMDKIKQIKHRLPNLKAAVQLYGPYEPYVKREDGYYRVSNGSFFFVNF